MSPLILHRRDFRLTQSPTTSKCQTTTKTRTQIFESPSPMLLHNIRIYIPRVTVLIVNKIVL